MNEQHEPCNCHDCTQARYKTSFQFQLDQVAKHFPSPSPDPDWHSKGIIANYEALISKIQKTVGEYFGPDERESDFDVLDQGVAKIAADAKASPSSGTGELTWTRLPDEQTWYWHWNGEDLAVPFIYSVMTSCSGAKNRYFIAYPDSRWCDEMGGWWLKIVRPNVPTREALRNAEAGRQPFVNPPSPKDRCSLDGAPRIPLNREGTEFGVCTLIGCTDPLHDYNLEQAAKADSKPSEEKCPTCHTSATQEEIQLARQAGKAWCSDSWHDADSKPSGEGTGEKCPRCGQPKEYPGMKCYGNEHDFHRMFGSNAPSAIGGGNHGGG